MSSHHLAARADVQATTGRVGEADRDNPGIDRLRRLTGLHLDAVRIHRRSGATP